MTPERWKKIDSILDEVLEKPDAEREKILADRCGDDKKLLKEIRKLLKADKKSEKFIENSAIKVVAQNFAEEKKANPTKENLSGKSLHNYKIEKLIGEGGMGEVYLANDEKLNRKVAIKILPSEYTASQERVARFEREASAISALNHPNIVTIHDVGKFNSTNYITTEFVEGKTLRDFLKEEMSLKEKLNLVIQCCNALSAAHQAGIIHRDIKPENIMVRPDGYVKVLDFGLAKLTEPKQINSKSLTETQKGTIMGTPAYISPEQISGTKVNSRTDLWSIGVILYELITGISPFKKDDRQATFQAILTENPVPPSSHNLEITSQLDQIVLKALEKNPDLSYQTASDLIADLKRIKLDIDSTSNSNNSVRNAVQKSSIPSYNFLRIALLSVFTILVGGLVWYLFFSNSSKTAGTDWSKAKNIQLTKKIGKENFPNLSPDGKSFVFASETEKGSDIFLQRVGGKKLINLTENTFEDDTQPAFSPDGKFIAFRSEREGGGIFVMEETGENPRPVSDFGFHPTWSPDGKQIAVSEEGYERPETRDSSSVWIINVSNGEKRELIGNYAVQPSWSPNGKRIAFWFTQSGGRRDVATISVEGGEPKLVTNSATTNWNPVWSPDGQFLYFSSDRSGNMAFWRVRIDQTTGKTFGEPEIIQTPAKFNGHLSFSNDGQRLIYVQTNNQSNIKAVEFDEKTEKPMGESYWVTQGDYELYRPQLSPDRNQFVARLVRQTQDDIVLINRDGTNWRDLTNDEHFDRYPRWSPDGKSIAFASDRSGIYQVWLIGADGSKLRQITPVNGVDGNIPIWSPDNKRISFDLKRQAHIVDTSSDLRKATPQLIPKIKEHKFLLFWDWSPDNTKLVGVYGNNDIEGIAYYSFESKNYEIVTKVSNMDEFPFWFPDSKRIVYPSQGKIFIVDINSKKPREVLSNPQENVTSVGISNDSSLLYYTVESSESNIWLLDLNQN